MMQIGVRSFAMQGKESYERRRRDMTLAVLLGAHAAWGPDGPLNPLEDRSPVWGTNYVEIECFVPETRVQY